MKRIETIEPGIYRRVNARTGEFLPTLWVHYSGPSGQTLHESARTTSVVNARKFRAKRIEEHRRGEPGRAAEKIQIVELLDALKINYTVNGHASLPTLLSHLKVLTSAFGHLRAIDLTTDRWERYVARWQAGGTSNGTINRRGNALRRALNLGRKARKVYVVPYVPRLVEHSPRGRYIPTTAAASLSEHLPTYLQPFFAFAYDNGTRKGQLARTLRRYVDLEQGVIAWPPAECKHKEAHTLPLEGTGLAIVEALMKRPPLHCPYLFHGPRCAPGHTPSKAYGCVGDFKKTWGAACKKAGLPAGRKVGGYTFHGTRHSAATNLRAAGLEEADCMRVTGHQTAHVFRHYDLGDTSALRQRIARARQRATVTTLRNRDEQGAAG